MPTSAIYLLITDSTSEPIYSYNPAGLPFYNDTKYGPW